MALTVTGGAESIAAQVEDLRAVADLFDRAAVDTQELLDYAGSWSVQAVVSGYGWAASGALDDVLARIVGPWSLPRLATESLRTSAAQLRFAAHAYTATDHGALDTIGAEFGRLGSFALAGGIGVATAVSEHSLSAGGEAFLTHDPGFVGDLAGPVLFTGLEQSVGAHYEDGHPVVSALGRDGGATVAPHDLPDLVDQLADRDETLAGEVSVAFVIGADGGRRVIVDVPGTKSWDPGHTSDVTSLATNARALVGASTTYERGVLRAMDRAGVRSTDPVMLVGHSEGGMVAVTAARDAVRAGRFDVTHVVTAGSPIARSVGDVPESVRVLALENDADLVPETDAAANPARPNVTTVGFDVNTGTVSGNHALRSAYEPGAAEAAASDDGSIRAFTDSAAGFLSGTGQDTELYLITREY